MPDVAIHHVFGRDVKERLPEEVRRDLADVPYGFALYGPDLWFMYEPWKRRQGRGRRMHTTRTGDFLNALAEKARGGSASREMFSYLAGFLCHYALDSTAHPYIVWQSTETWPTKHAHRDMEHALDIALLRREGFWGEKHPVTDHHFPRLKLPSGMAEDLNAVYREVYGWKHAWSALNQCYGRYRLLYRFLEKPRSLLSGLVAVFPTYGLRSIPYIRSAFLDRDVENLSHQPWHEAYARELTSTESFPELYDKAILEAVRMISDCHAFIHSPDFPADRLRESLGNRSYLSGLDVEDPRNYLVRSLRPPA